MKVVLKAQVPAYNKPHEKLLKIRSPDVYCGKFHMESYNFYLQYEDHYTTNRAKGLDRISFATSFFCDNINFRLQQYKQKLDIESTTSIFQNEFQMFFWQSLGDFRTFLDSYWAKIKRDSQYQQKDVLNQAEYLEHLHIVLRKFDFVVAPNNDSLI